MINFQFIVVSVALVLLAGLALYPLFALAGRRLTRLGFFFALVSAGFLQSMATKPEPEPEPPVVTNTVMFVLDDCLVHVGGGELVQYVESGSGATAPEVIAYPGYRFTGWDNPFAVVSNDLTVTALWNEVAPSKEEDWIGDIYVPTNGAGIPEGKIVVSSGTKVTVTVTGLPKKGLTYNKTTQTLVYDESTLPDGNYAIVVSAQNANKYKNDKVIAFTSEDHATETDPDDWSESYYVGQVCSTACSAFEAQSTKDTLTAKGLPAGLKLVKYTNDAGLPAYRIEGTPTKAGRSLVTWTVKYQLAGSSAGAFAPCYMTVQGAPSKYIEACADDLPTGCKVTGSGVYAAGAKATLKATAAKGYVFAGWHVDADVSSASEEDGSAPVDADVSSASEEDGSAPVDADVSSASIEKDTSLPAGVDYRNPTLTITDITSSPATYYPRFVELKEDSCGTITPTFNDDGIPEGVISVESVSLPTITVSGLPAGLTFNKTTNALLLNESKMKDGDYAFVISVKNAGGYKNDLVVTFTYGEPEDVPETWPTEYAVGAIIDEPLDFLAYTSKDTLKLTGLPTGLKLVTEYTVDGDGVKWPSYSIQGIPTKAGRSTVVWTETRYGDDGKVLKGDDAPEPVKYYMIVQGAPSRYIEVVVNGDSPSGCKATGSGVYAAGATVKTTATAAKGSVFAGWYAPVDADVSSASEEDDLTTNAFDNVYADYLGKDGDYRLAAQTWLCGTWYDESASEADAQRATVPGVLIARFIAQEADVMGDEPVFIAGAVHVGDIPEEEDVGDEWDVYLDEKHFPGTETASGCYQEIVISVDSISAPKLTIKGAPSGLTVKNYGTWATLYYDPTGKSVPKPGEYTLTVTAVNQSKASATRTITVRVPNQYALAADGTDLLDCLDTSADGAFAMTVGENMTNVFDAAHLTTDSFKTDSATLSQAGITISSIAVSGLPSGVTCKNGVFAGIPTKAGVYTMTVTVKYRIDGETKDRTASATAFFRVEAIDATCVGTFNGAVYEEATSPVDADVSSASEEDGSAPVDADVSSASEEVGTISATVSAAGKLTSCKLIDLKGKSTSITLKTQTFEATEGYYTISGKDKDGEEYVFTLSPAAESEEGRVTLSGALSADLPAAAREGTRRTGEAQQNVWSDKTLKAEGLLPVFPSKGVTVMYPAEADDPEVTLLFKSGGAVTATRAVNGKTKSASARFELIAYDAENGWTGWMTVNVPDGTDEGYCKAFDVTVTSELGVSVAERGSSDE